MLRWLVAVVPVLVLLAMSCELPAQEPKVALDQAGGKVAAEPPQVEVPTPRMPSARELRQLLAQPTDKLRGGIDPGTPLKDALDTIARLASTAQHRVDFRIDYGLFKAMNNTDQDQIDQSKVGMGALPKGSKVMLSKLLRDILVQANATYLVQGSEIAVVPAHVQFGDPHWANFLAVSTQFEKKPLAEAIDALSDLTGITVVLDGAAGDKAKTPITGTFKNVPLATAVRILSNMADLKPVVIDNVLYVTTKEKAQELIDDSAAEALPLISRSGGAAGA